MGAPFPSAGPVDALSDHKTKKTNLLTKRDRLIIAGRILAGVGGGYLCASLLAIASARLLPLARLDATIISTLMGLICWPIMVMVCFAARTAVRAWGIVLCVAMCLASTAFLGGWRP